MRVRGRRQCRACGTEWSYFETGTPACPECGSLRSVGVDAERTLHTDTPSSLDLTDARTHLHDRPVREAAAAAERAARSHTVTRGFVAGGELRPLDDVVLAAAELRFVAAEIRRRRSPADEVEAHFLALLESADAGDRPEAIPASLRAARGLAAAAVVGDYRRDVQAWLDERPDRSTPDVRSLLSDLQAHERRIEALDGDVPPDEAAHLVAAARGVGEHLRTGDADPRAAARRALDALAAAA